MNEKASRPQLHIRIVFAEKAMMGPGKAELLERIDRTGSIAAAGREMGMSYKRAWTLIESMNTMFRVPLVESTRGGSRGGGALLTETGRRVLALYRGFEAEATRAGARCLQEMRQLLNRNPEQNS